MDLQKYISEVSEASLQLMSVDLTTVKRPEDVHEHVAAAHKHLHRLCRQYRRHRVFRHLIVWSEQEAVAFGYLRFDEVEKP